MNEKDELYEKDITYKVLVDNYIHTSIEYAKKMNDETSKKLSESLNAVSKYRDQLRHNSLLSMMKELNFTSEDLVEAFEKHILSSKTLAKMIRCKFKKELEEVN